ncbi:MAG: FtsX-like permease family protein [Saprospiraceae bacterium]
MSYQQTTSRYSQLTAHTWYLIPFTFSSMFKNYFITSLRSMWRYRLFTGLNIFGIAISISACWMVYAIVRHEFSYDQSLPGKESIFRIVSGFTHDEKESYNGGVSAPMYQGIRADLNEIAHVVPVFEQWRTSIQINNPTASPIIIEDPTQIVSVDSAYFNMLPYTWLAGNQHTALSAPESVVLTESRMLQYFPGKSPSEVLNQTYTSYGLRDTMQKTVAGIVADFPETSEFLSKEFYSLVPEVYKLVEWTNTNSSDKLYLQLDPLAKPEHVNTMIQNLVEEKQKEFSISRNQPFTHSRWFEILPLKDIHFFTVLKERNVHKVSRPVMYGLAGIGLFLLVLACINYINMSAAQMPQRAKEIGVRKTLGSSQWLLIGPFLMETFLITASSSFIAFLLGRIGFWLLKDLMPAGLDPTENIFGLSIFVMILIVSITIISGLYPSWLITRVKTVNVFKNDLINRTTGSKFRMQKALIVFQFVIALVFILAAFIGGKQLQYTLKRDMGFNKDAVVLFDIPWKLRTTTSYEGKKLALMNELKKESGIRNISLGTAPLFDGYSSSLYTYTQEGNEPVKRQLFKKWVDTAYINLYDMELLAGRNLLPSDTTNELIVNESAVKAFGFTSASDAIGKMLKQGDRPIPIVGVVKDFNMQNFYSTIDPAALMSDQSNMRSFNIKLDKNHSEQWPKILQTIEKNWSQFFPAGSFQYRFYDQAIEQLYIQEHHMAKLINLATVIAILISCLGLFGLATLSVFQKTKEIGIRKVLGASVNGIIRLLSIEYIWLILLALLIASPLAWWAMNKWLSDFAYRIEIEWWMFSLAGVIVMAIALLTVGYLSVKAAIANPIKSLRTE